MQTSAKIKFLGKLGNIFTISAMSTQEVNSVSKTNSKHVSENKSSFNSHEVGSGGQKEQSFWSTLKSFFKGIYRKLFSRETKVKKAKNTTQNQGTSSRNKKVNAGVSPQTQVNSDSLQFSDFSVGIPSFRERVKPNIEKITSNVSNEISQLVDSASEWFATSLYESVQKGNMEYGGKFGKNDDLRKKMINIDNLSVEDLRKKGVFDEDSSVNILDVIETVTSKDYHRNDLNLVIDRIMYTPKEEPEKPTKPDDPKPDDTKPDDTKPDDNEKEEYEKTPNEAKEKMKKVLNEIKSLAAKKEYEKTLNEYEKTLNEAKENNRKILNAIKSRAEKKHPYNKEKQENFILHVIQSIHKWGGQAVATGNTSLFLGKRKILCSALRMQATITIEDDNTTTFQTHTRSCVIHSDVVDHNNNPGGHIGIFADEWTTYKVDIEDDNGSSVPKNTFPTIAPEGKNQIMAFKSEKWLEEIIKLNKQGLSATERDRTLIKFDPDDKTELLNAEIVPKTLLKLLQEDKNKYEKAEEVKTKLKKISKEFGVNSSILDGKNHKLESINKQIDQLKEQHNRFFPGSNLAE
ncbi:MAG: hypothetical protein LBI81_00390 [Puniceicoccales bacterium]|nr:hypothetical protein [Puniceicoccales bacterium]